MAELVPIGTAVRSVRNDIERNRARNSFREIRHVIEMQRDGICSKTEAEARILAVVGRELGEGR